MKKILLILSMIIGVFAGVSAKNTYAHDASVLPEAARSFITGNFNSKVSVVKIDKDFGQVHGYEVTLADGSEISFDRNGNWDNIETSNISSIPDRLIPKGIKDFVASNHKGARIVGIDKERSGYDIDLSNGIEIKFDKTGRFVKYD